MEDKDSVALSQISHVEDHSSRQQPLGAQGSMSQNLEDDEPSQHLSLRGFIVLTVRREQWFQDSQERQFKLTMTPQGIVGTYFATMIHLAGSGLLAQTIAAYLGAPSQSTWLTLSLIIMPITLGPSIAQAADFWGRKVFVVAGMVFGFTGCLIVSRSNSIGMAIAGQAIGGLGQPTQALTHAIMSEIMPRKYRSYAQAALQISVALSAVTALYVGGAMSRTNPEGFRNYFYFAAACFFFNAVVFAFLYRPPPRALQQLGIWIKIRSFDIGGMCLTITSFLGICIGLGWSQNPYPWSNVHVWLPFGLGAVSTVGLVIYATRFKRDGIYHCDLFGSRNFVIAEICFFAEGFMFLAFNNYVPYQISFLYGKDLFHTALEYSIAWWVVTVGAYLGGIYTARTRTIRPPLVFSFIMMAAFFGAMAGSNLSSNVHIYGLVALFGLALGMAMCSLVVLGQISVRADLISTASGLLLATRAGGGTVGLAVYNALFNAAVADKLASKVGAAAISHGLPPSSLGQLLGALTHNDQQALGHVPGINPQIIQASVLAMKESFNIAFRNVYIMSTAMAGVVLISMFDPDHRNISRYILTWVIVSCLMKEPKDQFTKAIDAPLFNNEKPKEVMVDD